MGSEERYKKNLRLKIFFLMIILIEAIVIIILSIKIINLSSATQSVAYCDRHFYDNQVCLLSPRIYTGILPSQNYMILNLDPLKSDIQNYIIANNLNVSVYVVNLRDSAVFGINSNQTYRAISLNKLPAAMIILKKVEENKLSLDTPLIIKDSDRDNNSGTLYAQPIDELSVRDLIHYMLAESDNTAFNVLADQITMEDLENMSSYLDYYNDNAEGKKIEEFYTTPKKTANIFISLYLSTVLKPEDSELILKELTNTSFDINKYAGLPPDLVVAQKYGSYFDNDPRYFHSCGIMYAGDNRILYCIMSEGLDRGKAFDVVGTIVNKIYKFVSQ